MRSFVRGSPRSTRASMPGRRSTFELSLPDTRYQDESQQRSRSSSSCCRACARSRRAVGGRRPFAAARPARASILSFEIEGRPKLPPSQQPAMQVRVATTGLFPDDWDSAPARPPLSDRRSPRIAAGQCSSPRARRDSTSRARIRSGRQSRSAGDAAWQATRRRASSSASWATSRMPGSTRPIRRRSICRTTSGRSRA